MTLGAPVFKGKSLGSTEVLEWGRPLENLENLGKMRAGMGGPK